MEPISVIVTAVGVLFVATLARSTFGFGDALIAMPLLTLLLGIRSATPIIALIGSGVTLLIVWRSHARIDLAAIKRLTLSALLGIPFGIWLFTALPAGLVTVVLGICLILFGGYALWRPSTAVVSDARWAYPFGFIAGGNPRGTTRRTPQSRHSERAIRAHHPCRTHPLGCSAPVLGRRGYERRHTRPDREDRVDEGLQLGRRRRGEQPSRRTLLPDTASMHEHDGVGGAAGKAHLVRYQHP